MEKYNETVTIKNTGDKQIISIKAATKSIAGLKMFRYMKMYSCQLQTVSVCVLYRMGSVMTSMLYLVSHEGIATDRQAQNPSNIFLSVLCGLVRKFLLVFQG